MSVFLATLMAATALHAAGMPSEPLGGKPPAGWTFVDSLADQVMYQRAFEAVIWSMPAVAKYGLHRATFDMGAGNNVVLKVPPATDKAGLFGQVADNWYITIADIGPIGVDKGKPYNPDKKTVQIFKLEDVEAVE